MVQEKGQSEPYLLILGTPSDLVQAFLVVDVELLSHIDILGLPIVIIIYPHFMILIFVIVRVTTIFQVFWN